MSGIDVFLRFSSLIWLLRMKQVPPFKSFAKLKASSESNHKSHSNPHPRANQSKHTGNMEVTLAKTTAIPSRDFDLWNPILLS